MTSATTMRGEGRKEDRVGTFISMLVITVGGLGGKGCLRAGGEGEEGT